MQQQPPPLLEENQEVFLGDIFAVNYPQQTDTSVRAPFYYVDSLVPGNIELIELPSMARKQYSSPTLHAALRTHANASGITIVYRSEHVYDRGYARQHRLVPGATVRIVFQGSSVALEDNLRHAPLLATVESIDDDTDRIRLRLAPDAAAIAQRDDIEIPFGFLGIPLNFQIQSLILVDAAAAAAPAHSPDAGADAAAEELPQTTVVQPQQQQQQQTMVAEMDIFGTRADMYAWNTGGRGNAKKNNNNIPMDEQILDFYRAELPHDRGSTRNEYLHARSMLCFYLQLRRTECCLKDTHAWIDVRACPWVLPIADAENADADALGDNGSGYREAVVLQKHAITTTTWMSNTEAAQSDAFLMLPARWIYNSRLLLPESTTSLMHLVNDPNLQRYLPKWILWHKSLSTSTPPPPRFRRSQWGLRMQKTTNAAVDLRLTVSELLNVLLKKASDNDNDTIAWLGAISFVDIVAAEFGPYLVSPKHFVHARHRQKMDDILQVLIAAYENRHRTGESKCNNNVVPKIPLSIAAKFYSVFGGGGSGGDEPWRMLAHPCCSGSGGSGSGGTTTTSIENLYAGEMLSFVKEIDFGQLLCTMIADQAFVVDRLQQTESLLRAYRSRDFLNQDPSDCLYRKLVKRYRNYNELQKDNGAIALPVAKEFDTTPYGLKHEIMRRPKSQWRSSSLEKEIENELVSRFSYSREQAANVTNFILFGKRYVQEDEYAVVVMAPQSASASAASTGERQYFRWTKERQWVLDPNVDDMSFITVCTDAIAAVVPTKNDSAVAKDTKKQVRNVFLEKMLHIFGTRIEETQASLQAKIKNDMELCIARYRATVAAATQLPIRWLPPPPVPPPPTTTPTQQPQPVCLRRDIFESMMAQYQFPHQEECFWERIFQFTTVCCRPADWIVGEDPRWLYCREQPNMQLVPTAFGRLARARMVFGPAAFAETLRVICQKQGMLLNEYGIVVDRKSGYVLCYQSSIASAASMIAAAHAVIPKTNNNWRQRALQMEEQQARVYDEIVKGFCGGMVATTTAAATEVEIQARTQFAESEKLFMLLCETAGVPVPAMSRLRAVFLHLAPLFTKKSKRAFDGENPGVWRNYTQYIKCMLVSFTAAVFILLVQSFDLAEKMQPSTLAISWRCIKNKTTKKPFYGYPLLSSSASASATASANELRRSSSAIQYVSCLLAHFNELFHSSSSVAQNAYFGCWRFIPKQYSEDQWSIGIFRYTQKLLARAEFQDIFTQIQTRRRHRQVTSSTNIYEEDARDMMEVMSRGQDILHRYESFKSLRRIVQWKEQMDMARVLLPRMGRILKQKVKDAAGAIAAAAATTMESQQYSILGRLLDAETAAAEETKSNEKDASSSIVAVLDVTRVLEKMHCLYRRCARSTTIRFLSSPNTAAAAAATAVATAIQPQSHSLKEGLLPAVYELYLVYLHDVARPRHRRRRHLPRGLRRLPKVQKAVEALCEWWRTVAPSLPSGAGAAATAQERMINQMVYLKDKHNIFLSDGEDRDAFINAMATIIPAPVPPTVTTTAPAPTTTTITDAAAAADEDDLLLENILFGGSSTIPQEYMELAKSRLLSSASSEIDNMSILWGCAQSSVVAIDIARMLACEIPMAIASGAVCAARGKLSFDWLSVSQYTHPIPWPQLLPWANALQLQPKIIHIRKVIRAHNEVGSSTYLAALCVAEYLRVADDLNVRLNVEGVLRNVFRYIHTVMNLNKEALFMLPENDDENSDDDDENDLARIMSMDLLSEEDRQLRAEWRRLARASVE